MGIRTDLGDLLLALEFGLLVLQFSLLLGLIVPQFQPVHFFLVLKLSVMLVLLQFDILLVSLAQPGLPRYALAFWPASVLVLMATAGALSRP